ncbi:MAG: histidine ammonia-lyase [Phycisphaerales bacterium]|nr:histidine ammonia-lyase [Phycisphaerales bacterium]
MIAKSQGGEAWQVVLNGDPLTLDGLRQIFDRRIDVALTDGVWARVTEARQRVDAIATGTRAVYGVNTGFGHLCRKRIEPDALTQLQDNLILSHAVGVGPAVPDELVRLMLLLKICSLTHGFSGISEPVLRGLMALLKHDLLPHIPQQGSLGASGDLAPLAHMVLPLIGHGTVRLDGVEMAAADALAKFDVAQVKLQPKDGVALINGTQFMAAYAVGLILRARHLLKHADIVASISLEGLQGSLAPFAEKLHALRPHRGAIETASNVRRLMDGSKILESHANCEKVQDPYSLRCVPQVHGAVRQAVHHAADVVETEINSVTDNPIIFEDGSTISGGLFHGEPLAIMLDYLAIALAELASISERRTYLLLSGHDGLPELLMKETGLNSGFMLPQYTAAALVSENKVLCSPASVDSIPTSLGQEDHVSMGATAATKAWRVLDNVETVLAIEEMCAAQALDYRAPIEPGRGVKIAHEVIRSRIAHAEADRLFGYDINVSLQTLREHAVVNAVEAELGELQ